jgi:hypothetical protein
VVLEQIIVLLVDFGLDFVFDPQLVVELQILAPFWAIFDAPTHLIFDPTWERSMVLYQT